MKRPNIITVDEVLRVAATVAAGLPDGRYVPARPLPFYGARAYFRAIWLVSTGRADALLWDSQ